MYNQAGGMPWVTSEQSWHRWEHPSPSANSMASSTRWKCTWKRAPYSVEALQRLWKGSRGNRQAVSGRPARTNTAGQSCHSLSQHSGEKIGPWSVETTRQESLMRNTYVGTWRIIEMEQWDQALTTSLCQDISPSERIIWASFSSEPCMAISIIVFRPTRRRNAWSVPGRVRMRKWTRSVDVDGRSLRDGQLQGKIIFMKGMNQGSLRKNRDEQRGERETTHATSTCKQPRVI